MGGSFNSAQTSGFYTRLLRDEVIAEWRHELEDGLQISSLHVFVHVSGAERWLAPPQLRNYIFRRELPLVSLSHEACFSAEHVCEMSFDMFLTLPSWEDSEASIFIHTTEGVKL